MDGSLLFFPDHERDHRDGGYARVLQVPTGVDTEVAEPPTGIAEQTLAGREQAGEIGIPVTQWYSRWSGRPTG